MIKCGIITYHFATNYGAMLQCFALKQALETMECEVEVLNFITAKQSDNNSLYRNKQGLKGYIKNILVLPFHFIRLKRQDRCIEFRNKYLLSDQARLQTINQLKQYCVKKNFDVLISGSDQVWNPQVYDFSEAFFFPFDCKAKKVGYAISIGNATFAVLEKYQKWVKQFEKITVREKQSIKIVEKLSGKQNIVAVVDPVFLLKKEQWTKIIKTNNYSKYLLCYFVKSKKIDKKISTAHEIAKIKGLTVIIVNARISKLNLIEKTISDAGPLEFLSLINFAQFVCTDSFHGTAFSVLLEKEFVTFIDSSEGTDSRKLNLLDNVGLLERAVDLDTGLNLNKYDNIDYAILSKKVENLRNCSLKILNNLIKKD